MKILFIKPNMGLVQGRPYDDRGRMEPHTFAVLAGFTPERHEIVLCDDRFDPVPFGGTWDLVGINTEIYTARRAYEIADRFRDHGVPVVLGGCHATMIPEEAALHADAVAMGDTDILWQSILEDAESKRLKPAYQSRKTCNGVIDDITPSRGLYRGKKYLPVRLTQFSRGCVNTCEYCTTGNLYGGSHTHRSPQAVADELARDGRRMVFFVDDNLIVDVDAAKELFRHLIPLRLRWTAQASLAFVSDPELMDLMVRSGCMGLVVGFESRDPANLEAMNKPSNLAFGSYDEVVEKIRSAGIMLWAAFLLGYDHETEHGMMLGYRGYERPPAK